MEGKDHIKDTQQDPIRATLQAHFDDLPPADDSEAHMRAGFNSMLAESRKRRTAAARMGFFRGNWAAVRNAVATRPARAMLAFGGVLSCILVAVLVLRGSPGASDSEQMAQTTQRPATSRKAPAPAAIPAGNQDGVETTPAMSLASIPLGITLRGFAPTMEQDTLLASAHDIIVRDLAEQGVAATRRGNSIVTDYRVIDEATNTENALVFVIHPGDNVIRIMPTRFRPLPVSLERADIARIHRRIRDDIRLMARFAK